MSTHTKKPPSQQKYKANENTSTQVTSQRKNNNKQSTKITWKLYAKVTHGCKMTLNNNKQNLRQNNSHLPQIN
jgi:hypothetical protein